jgi:hypothetical protein
MLIFSLPASAQTAKCATITALVKSGVSKASELGLTQQDQKFLGKSAQKLADAVSGIVNGTPSVPVYRVDILFVDKEHTAFFVVSDKNGCIKNDLSAAGPLDTFNEFVKEVLGQPI